MKTQERHPYPATLGQIISHIDYEMKKYDYKKIFLVTEELKLCEQIKTKI